MQRQPIDLSAYARRSREGPCFVCGIVDGSGDPPHYIVYEDAISIAFLNRYPTLYGYALVAPRRHREQATGDFTADEYLVPQAVVYRVAEAVRAAVPTERLYILSLGSQQGNRHVHWHIAPLPPGVPYQAQQLAALAMERGVLAMPEDEAEALAARIREQIEGARG